MMDLRGGQGGGEELCDQSSVAWSNGMQAEDPLAVAASVTQASGIYSGENIII